MQWALASHNKGKIREFRQLLAPLSISIQSSSTFSHEVPAETANTFVENALIKARHIAKLTTLPVLGDDSGLVVPYLNGAPGIVSSRYAGIDDNHDANIAKLLSALKPATIEERKAYFYCVLVLLQSPTDPAPLIIEGRWWGQIALKKSGNHGFGYDSIFYIPNLNTTAANLSPEQKNLLSHRGQALRSLINTLKLV